MVTPQPGRKQLSHDRILGTAARALREGGFAGIGVADIMNRAGLTHGGFYAHFPSRDALLSAALERASLDSDERLRHCLKDGKRKDLSPFHALVNSYLSTRHMTSPEGCPVAALASEMPLQSEAVRQAASTSVVRLVRTIAETLPACHAEGSAAVVASQMVGALQLARALGDNAASHRHLAATRRFLLEQFDSPQPTRR
ncbi:HTH-type transcriptional repressor NemR [compost metagenome]